MKLLSDFTCARCGHTLSITGMDVVRAGEVAMAHVCVDGVRHPITDQPTARVVYGPGERLSDEERRA